MPTNAQYEAMRLDIACLTRENEELRGKLVAAEAHESTLASLCDWINTHCRECGVAEADWYTLPMMRDAIDRIVFAQRKREHYLRTKLAAAEAERDALTVTGSMIMGAICGTCGPLTYASVIEAFDELEQRLAAAEEMSETRRVMLVDSFDNVTNLCKERDELKAQLAAARGLLREAVEIGEQSWNRTCFGLLWVERAKKEGGDE